AYTAACRPAGAYRRCLGAAPAYWRCLGAGTILQSTGVVWGSARLAYSRCLGGRARQLALSGGPRRPTGVVWGVGAPGPLALSGGRRAWPAGVVKWEARWGGAYWAL